MKVLYLLIFAAFVQNASAGEITRYVKKNTETETIVGNSNIISPDKVSVAQYPLDKSLHDVLESYSDAELRNLAIAYNQAEITEARRNHKPVPPKLDSETLGSREKIGEYLRSIYQYQY